MINLEEAYGEVFRMELADAHNRMNQDMSCVSHECYLLGVADGIVIMATHLGIVLRPDLLEGVKE